MLCAIQTLFCVAILLSGEIKPSYNNNYLLNLCVFFTNLGLHYSCIAIIRNGLVMCKAAVFKSEDYSNPVEMFILGSCIMLTNVLCEVTNALSSLDQKTIVGVISKFVAFKVLMQI